MMEISKIYVYPIKSLRGIELSNAVATKHGFSYDRRFMLLRIQDDGSLKNMSVAENPELALFFTSLDFSKGNEPQDATITITYKPPERSERTLIAPLLPDTDDLDSVTVTLYKSSTAAFNMGSKYNDWFSECLGHSTVLAFLGTNTRPVLFATGASDASNGSWISAISSIIPASIGNFIGTNNRENTPKNREITFADVAPYLVVSATSLRNVSKRLPGDEGMDITKFRPNIVISGAEQEWEEDFWAGLSVGDVRLDLVHNCCRCGAIDVDYATGKRSTEEAGMALKKLASDRRVDTGKKANPVFGRYAFLQPGGHGKSIAVGDGVTVTSRNSERTIWDWPSNKTETNPTPQP